MKDIIIRSIFGYIGGCVAIYLVRGLFINVYHAFIAFTILVVLDMLLQIIKIKQ